MQKQAVLKTLARPQPRPQSARFWEIDTLRGVAIVMMTTYHLMWDFWYFRIMPDVVLWAGFWKYFQRTTATLFILLVGVSLTVSYRRVEQSGQGRAGLWRKFAVRALRVMGIGLALGLVVSTAGMGYVDFGVLHLIGLSIILVYPFLRLRWPNLLLWALCFVAGGWIATIHVDTRWLVWLGLTPVRYAPNDFFPMLPWFGVVLLGVFVGNTFYTGQGRLLPLPDWSRFWPLQALRFLGRHSLVIYLIHQPLLLVILYALGLVKF